MSYPAAMLDLVMSRRGASPVLVGRAAEMATLEAALPDQPQRIGLRCDQWLSLFGADGLDPATADDP